MNLIYNELVDDTCIKKYVSLSAFDEHYDVIVAGLGSAGSFLSLSVAENCRVLAIEKMNSVGGTCTNGFVCSYYHGLNGGLFEEIDRKSAESSDIYRRGIKNPYAKSDCLYEHLAENKNITLAFKSVIIGIYENENTVIGVKALIDGELKNIACKFLCDCTADGHILKILNVKHIIGRDGDGISAPFTINKYYREDGEIKSVATDAGYINQYDSVEFTKAVLNAKTEFTKEKYRRIIACAPMSGLREGMSFEGEYTLTINDAVYEKCVPNVLLYADSDIDRHGEDYYLGGDVWKDWFVHCNLSTVSLKIPVPAGCLVPKGKNGIISACRCLSADSYISSAVRMVRDMHRLGECAGVAVAEAVKSGRTNILELDFEKIQDKLKARGCFDSNERQSKGFEERGGAYLPFEWMTEKEEIISALSTDKPGVALWSCNLLGREKAEEFLENELKSDNPMLRKNSAIALGITGSETCLAVLREMVRNRTDDFLNDCRRTNQMQSIIAVSLCGRFADTEITEELCKILDLREYGKEMYHTHLEDNYRLSTHSDFNSIYFQYLSFALYSLNEICKKHSEIKAEITESLKEFIGNKGIVFSRIVINPNRQNYVSQTEALFDFAAKIIRNCDMAVNYLAYSKSRLV